MEIPTWFKPAVYGAVVGAAILGTVGFSWGGWVTGAKANVMATDQAKEEVLAALVPICVSNAAADPMAVDKIAELKAASSYKRTEVLANTGWATMLGSDKPNNAVSKACALELIQ